MNHISRTQQEQMFNANRLIVMGQSPGWYWSLGACLLNKACRSVAITGATLLVLGGVPVYWPSNCNMPYWGNMHMELPGDFIKLCQIGKFMGPIWGPPGSCRPKMGPFGPHEPCYQGSVLYHCPNNHKEYSMLHIPSLTKTTSTDDRSWNIGWIYSWIYW